MWSVQGYHPAAQDPATGKAFIGLSSLNNLRRVGGLKDPWNVGCSEAPWLGYVGILGKLMIAELIDHSLFVFEEATLVQTIQHVFPCELLSSVVSLLDGKRISWVLLRLATCLICRNICLATETLTLSQGSTHHSVLAEQKPGTFPAAFPAAPQTKKNLSDLLSS